MTEAKVYLRAKKVSKEVLITDIDKPILEKSVTDKWKNIMDIIAEVFEVPAALIMKINKDNMEVFIKSSNADNPYPENGKETLGKGLYCETVIGTNQELLVKDSLNSDVWKENPDVSLNMISYYGVPIHWPDGEVFGTLCVLNSKPDDFVSNSKNKKLIEGFKKAFEDDLSDAHKIRVMKESFMSLQKSEKIFKALYEDAPIGYQSLDKNGDLLLVNHSYARMLGHDRKDMIGKNFGDFMDKESEEVFPKFFKQFKKTKSIDIIFNMLHKDGHRIPVRFVGKIAVNVDGDFKQTHCILMDVSKEIEFQKELISSKENLENILDLTSEGIFGVDTQGICTFINTNALNILGYDNKEELIGKNMHNLIHHSGIDRKKHDASTCQVLRSIIEGIPLRIDDETLWKKNGLPFSAEFNSFPIFNNEKVTGSVISFKDISRRKEISDSLAKMSYQDSLTGLYNRRFYEKELSSLDNPRNYPLSIIVGDINGLKLINDAFGHETGDELLIETAKSILSNVPSNALVARIGGDEYVVVLPKSSLKEATKYVNKIIESSSKFNVNGIDLSISFGIATKLNEDENINAIYRDAEDDMYRTKLSEIPSMRSNAIETILQTLNEKDANSEEHSRKVSIIAEKLAIAAKLEYKDIFDVKTAALLHDIGKIIIPSSILNKQGLLTGSEYEVMKKHSEIGYRILNSSPDLRRISSITLMHHERWDGLGYPSGFSGEEIPLNARIITIADSYDAMVSNRTYKKLKTKEEALLEIIAYSGKQFDPTLVQIFKDNFAEITKNT